MRRWGSWVALGVLLAAGCAMSVPALLAGTGPLSEASDRSDISAPRLVKGLLKSVESKPNMPSARCGYHFELLVASASGPVRVMVNDRTAPLERLDDLVDREVEIMLDAGNVARSIHVPGTKPQANDKLSNLSSTRHC
jgi:hypothetical protein